MTVLKSSLKVLDLRREQSILLVSSGSNRYKLHVMRPKETCFDEVFRFSLMSSFIY